ncbi:MULTISPECIES: WXG100-like domain-containing protein [Saccharothrix]|uniref:WXG100-like domain-containing protein n=1 Tax=Saccharothrix TaxID=2071 RepID=UPI00093C7C14|nr:hypothetical protein [Saccharothrix sp. CB00851]OKI13884.1 hypothetical protein A6A25_16575 [Saccharothrix sp. CB00851]
MPIAPPSSAHGLWPRVNALVEWPDTDEDMMRLLAAEWGEAAGHTEPLSRLDLGPIATAWADPAGQAFHGRMTALGAAAGEVGTRMHALQTLAAAFATDVTSAKQTIVDVINANIPLYAKAAQLDPAVAAATQDRFVTEIAAWLNAYLASLAGHGPPPPPFVPPEGPAKEGDGDTVFGEIGKWAGVTSAVAGTLALIPGVNAFAAPVALLAGGVALAANATDMAITGDFDLATLVGDTLGVLPGVAAIKNAEHAITGIGSLLRAADTGFEAAPLLKAAAEGVFSNPAVSTGVAVGVQGGVSLATQVPAILGWGEEAEGVATAIAANANGVQAIPDRWVNVMRGLS